MMNPYREMEYQDYLTTVHWEKTREQKLREVDNCCESCLQQGLIRRGNLEVHHVTYERLGEERMDDLRALCAVCHRRAHGIEPRAKDFNRLTFVYGHETVANHNAILRQRMNTQDVDFYQ